MYQGLSHVTSQHNWWYLLWKRKLGPSLGFQLPRLLLFLPHVAASGRKHWWVCISQQEFESDEKFSTTACKIPGRRHLLTNFKSAFPFLGSFVFTSTFWWLHVPGEGYILAIHRRRMFVSHILDDFYFLEEVEILSWKLRGWTYFLS